MVHVWPDKSPELDLWNTMDALNFYLELRPDRFRRINGHVVCNTTRGEYEAFLNTLHIRRGTRHSVALVIGLPQGYRLVQDPPAYVDAEPKPFVYRELPEEVRLANWKKAKSEGLVRAEKELPPEEP